MINLLIWNAWGVAGKIIQRRIKKLKFMHQIIILAILEPMVQGSQIDFLRRKLGFDGAVANCSQNIWLFWTHEVCCSIRFDHPQCLHASFSLPWLSFSFQSSFIYAKCTRLEMQDLWAFLRNVATGIQEPLLAGGDFNVILNREETLLSAEPHARSMEDFAMTLFDCGLLDAGFEGNKFTWTNSPYVLEVGHNSLQYTVGYSICKNESSTPQQRWF